MVKGVHTSASASIAGPTIEITRREGGGGLGTSGDPLVRNTNLCYVVIFDYKVFDVHILSELKNLMENFYYYSSICHTFG